MCECDLFQMEKHVILSKYFLLSPNLFVTLGSSWIMKYGIYLYRLYILSTLQNKYFLFCLFTTLLIPQEYQKVVDAEWEILYRKLEKIVESGAKVVLSKLPIGDVATQYFADRWGSLFELVRITIKGSRGKKHK